MRGDAGRTQGAHRGVLHPVLEELYHLRRATGREQLQGANRGWAAFHLGSTALPHGSISRGVNRLYMMHLRLARLIYLLTTMAMHGFGMTTSAA